MKIENIFKKYDSGFELDIPCLELKGNVIGILGHIGSGKTSLLKTLSKLNNGSYTRSDNDYFYMVEFDKLPRSKVKLISNVFESIKPHFNRDRFNSLLDIFKIDIEDITSELSDGQKKILSFILTISIESEILLLDEPFSKIDPYNRKNMINTIIEVAKNYKHIIVASHEIGNLQRIIDYAVLIKDGKIINSSSIEEIEKEFPDIKEWYRENYKD